MTALAPTLQAFFTDRLARQKNASPHTIAAYRDTLRLLLGFAWQRTGTPPSRLGIDDLDAPLIAAFLDHLQDERGNSARSRNARLAAIHSLFSFAALRHPEHAETIGRVLAIPPKRFTRAVVSYLTDQEAGALLAAPDTSRRIGRRDHALLAVATQTGLRVSELTGLRCQDVNLGRGAHLSCTGKGRKQRCTPLTSQTVTILRAWLRERRGQPADPLFPTSRGRALSRDAVALLISRHAAKASQSCPSLQAKTITPHTLRHTAAMRLLHAGVDTSVIALWLGHEKTDTVQIYLHADLSLKERALARTTRPALPPDATARPMTCSPSSKRSDYADLRGAEPLASSRSGHPAGIIRSSA
jgi:integrase/recombinase XerD